MSKGILFVLGLLAGIAIGVAATWLVLSTGNREPGVAEMPVADTPTATSVSLEMQACLASHELISDEVLVSPATAQYQPCEEAVFRGAPAYPGELVIESFVDSETRAGGLVRTYYVARVAAEGEGWVLTYFAERDR